MRSTESEGAEPQTIWQRIQFVLHALRLVEASSWTLVRPTAVARVLNVSQPAVSNWRTRNSPAREHLRTIAQLTGASVEWLETGRGGAWVAQESGAAGAPLSQPEAVLFADPDLAELVRVFRTLRADGRAFVMQAARYAANQSRRDREAKDARKGHD